MDQLLVSRIKNYKLNALIFLVLSGGLAILCQSCERRFAYKQYFATFSSQANFIRKEMLRERAS